MLLVVLMQYSCIMSHLTLLERRFRDIQIVIITNFVAVMIVSMKKDDCITESTALVAHPAIYDTSIGCKMDFFFVNSKTSMIRG